MNSYLAGYEPYRGEITQPEQRIAGLRPHGRGRGLRHLPPGTPRPDFVVPGDRGSTRGMIVGEHNRDLDLDINVCKEKKLSNMRSAGKDDNILLTPVKPMTLEASLNFLRDDEWLEVTPKSLRLRKQYLDIASRKQPREETQ